MGKLNLRRSILLFSFFSVLLAGSVSAQEKGAASGEQMKDAGAGAPSIKFTEQRFEAGTVTEGALVCHEFTFVNEGTGVLNIRNVIPA